MRTNQAGLDLIRSFESLRLDAYRCPAGVLSIGFGHTGPDVQDGMSITAERAEELFRQDIAVFEDGVTYLVPPWTRQNQFSALVSFAYNCGLDALAGSTLLRKFNAGDIIGAANEFVRWNKSGGRVLNGLTRRRNAERALFMLDGGKAPQIASGGM